MNLAIRGFSADLQKITSTCHDWRGHPRSSDGFGELGDAVGHGRQMAPGKPAAGREVRAAGPKH